MNSLLILFALYKQIGYVCTINMRHTSNMTNNPELTELKDVAEIWHYREVASRTEKSLSLVKKVLKYKTRKNELIESEFIKVVSECEERKAELSKLNK
jgi:hypothetical protein